MNRRMILFRGYWALLLGIASVALAVFSMLATLDNLHSDIFSCFGQLGAGFPVAMVCDYSGGGSPLSSAGKIDGADSPFVSPHGLLVDYIFYSLLLSAGFLSIDHLSRARVRPTRPE
jgi:hypothetical protein